MGFNKRRKRPELYRDPSVKPTAEVQRRLDAEEASEAAADESVDKPAKHAKGGKHHVKKKHR